MEYEATQCVEGREKLTLIDPDEDPTLHDDESSDNVLDVDQVISYATLQGLTSQAPLVLQVDEPAGRGDVDCCDGQTLVECNSDLIYSGTITVTPTS